MKDFLTFIFDEGYFWGSIMAIVGVYVVISGVRIKKRKKFFSVIPKMKNAEYEPVIGKHSGRQARRIGNIYIAFGIFVILFSLVNLLQY